MEKENKDNKENIDSDKTKNNEKDDVEDLLKNNPGYGYWKREEDLIDRDKFIPKPIENVETNKLVLESKTSVGSAWNTAGTWEEKHYKKSSIEDYFNEKIKGITVDGIKLESVKNYSGDVSVYLTINYLAIFAITYLIGIYCFCQTKGQASL